MWPGVAAAPSAAANLATRQRCSTEALAARESRRVHRDEVCRVRIEYEARLGRTRRRQPLVVVVVVAQSLAVGCHSRRRRPHRTRSSQPRSCVRVPAPRCDPSPSCGCERRGSRRRWQQQQRRRRRRRFQRRSSSARALAPAAALAPRTPAAAQQSRWQPLTREQRRAQQLADCQHRPRPRPRHARRVRGQSNPIPRTPIPPCTDVGLV